LDSENAQMAMQLEITSCKVSINWVTIPSQKAVGSVLEKADSNPVLPTMTLG
jgi:hypothetical protein